MKIAGLLFFFVLQSTLSWGHSYKLDSYGCHNNGKLNIYECHQGDFAGKSWQNPGGQDAMLQERAVVAKPFLDWKGTATLTWTSNDPTDTITGYRLYWTIIADDKPFQGPVDMGNVTSIDLAGLMKGATYYFYITAYNAVGESPRSNIVSKEIK